MFLCVAFIITHTSQPVNDGFEVGSSREVRGKKWNDDTDIKPIVMWKFKTVCVHVHVCVYMTIEICIKMCI